MPVNKRKQIKTREQFLARMAELYDLNVEIARKKNGDYANGADPFQNFRQCEHLGFATVECGILVRMTDKMTRISNLITRDAEVRDEGIADTLKDLANYAMILLMWLEQKA